MRSEPRLETLQQWLHAVIAHPGDVYEALESDQARQYVDDVERAVLPSKTLQPAQRVGVYHGMYLMRMVEALEADYPAVKQFLGCGAFENLVRDYVQQFPSSSFTLNRLGDRFPDFLAASKVRHRVFLSDLARLELAMTEVFDEEEATPLAADSIANVEPETLPSLRFRAIPALRLLAFAYDASAAFQSYRDEEQIHPVRRKSWVAVHRRDFSVYRMPLSQPQFFLLRTLVDGETIGDALTSFYRRYRRLPEQHELFTWFRDWSAAGLFAAMETR